MNYRMPRILVIDDDIDLLMLLERILLKQGYAVETAASIREAEEYLDYFQPHLVLLDINVKGEDGRKLCWNLKYSGRYPALKVMIISGYDHSPARAKLFGADALLSKPLHIDYLLHQVELLLEARPVEREI